MLLIGLAVLAGVVVSALTVLPSLRAINASLACATIDCDADLLAQQQMAIAAWVMVAVTAFTGVLSLILIYSTLQAARRSAVAAEDAVEHTQKFGMAQSRSYLTVSKVTFVGSMLEGASIVVTFKNSGSTPAGKVTALLSLTVETDDVESPFNLRQGMGIHLPDLGAGDRMEYEIELYDFWDYVPVRSVEFGQVLIRMKGVAIYQDIFEAEHKYHIDFVGLPNADAHTIELRPTPFEVWDGDDVAG